MDAKRLDTVEENMRELENLLGQFSEDAVDLWMRRCSRNAPKGGRSVYQSMIGHWRCS